MLAIDIGNSRIKWAEFNESEIQRHGCFEYAAEDLQISLKRENLPLGSAVVEVSCVAAESVKKQLIDFINSNNGSRVNFAQTQVNQCGVSNSYERVSKMGIDRWLAMIAAYKLLKAESAERICVIDCGTAITLDLLDAEGQHMGGLIMPGYQTMRRSLVRGTGNIQQANEVQYVAPLVSGLASSILASSTQDAVSKGCAQLIVGGLSDIVGRYRSGADGGLRCVVTGGDGEWVSQALACENVYDPFLVLRGLNLASFNSNG